MADFALSTMNTLPVSIACLGLLYCQADGVVGQHGDNLNLVDLAMLPLTPIMASTLYSYTRYASHILTFLPYVFGREMAPRPCSHKK